MWFPAERMCITCGFLNPCMRARLGFDIKTTSFWCSARLVIQKFTCIESGWGHFAYCLVFFTSSFIISYLGFMLHFQIFLNFKNLFKIENSSKFIPIFCKMLLILSSFLWSWICKLCLAGKLICSRMIEYICICDLALLFPLWNAWF
jgi:hypothetical protein